MTDTTHRALLEQALEALDSGCFIPPASSWHKAIRAELAKPATAQNNALETIALKSERDAAKKDADRYRYLRGQRHWSKALEEAIDAAIVKAEGGAA